MNTNLLKHKKKLAWLLRDDRYSSNKDENGFIEIDKLLEKYYEHKKQEIKDDAYYCHYIWKPHDRGSYAKFNSIDSLIQKTFVLPCQYITPEQFNTLLNDFIEKYLLYFANLSFQTCVEIQTFYSDEFAINETRTKIRAIRSWEKNK